MHMGDDRSSGDELREQAAERVDDANKLEEAADARDEADAADERADEAEDEAGGE